jgi:hypothetical protein
VRVETAGQLAAFMRYVNSNPARRSPAASTGTTTSGRGATRRSS